MISKLRSYQDSERMQAVDVSDREKAPLSDSPQAEQRLVDDCVAGNAKAWEELVARYNDYLHTRIRASLGSRSRDINVVDEIAAEVWSTLYRKTESLLGRFRAEEGQPLSTFLGGVARIEVLRFRRSEHQRRCHELSPEIFQLTAESTCDDGNRLLTAGLVEFASVLTPRQRQFLHEDLLNGLKHVSASKLSATNRWQLRHRIRCKLLEFLDGH